MGALTLTGRTPDLHFHETLDDDTCVASLPWCYPWSALVPLHGATPLRILGGICSCQLLTLMFFFYQLRAMLMFLILVSCCDIYYDYLIFMRYLTPSIANKATPFFLVHMTIPAGGRQACYTTFLVPVFETLKWLFAVAVNCSRDWSSAPPFFRGTSHCLLYRYHHIQIMHFNMNSGVHC